MLLASPASAFDCTKAYMPVDFVICSDQAVVRANDVHEKAWFETRAKMNEVEKGNMLFSQRQWLKQFPQTCGVPATGKRPSNITESMQRCVERALLDRAEYIRNYQLGKQTVSEEGRNAPQPAPTPASTSSDIALGNDIYLIPLGDDKQLGVRYWAYGFKHDVCHAEPMEFWQPRNTISLRTLITVASASTMWDDNVVKSIFNAAGNLHLRKCEASRGNADWQTTNNWYMTAFLESALPSVISNNTNNIQVLASASGNPRGSQIVPYSYERANHEESLRLQRLAEEAEDRRRAEIQAKNDDAARAREVRAKFYADVAEPLEGVAFDELSANSFAHVGKAVSYAADFRQM